MTLAQALEIIMTRKATTELLFRPVSLKGTGRALMVRSKQITDADDEDKIIPLSDVNLITLEWELLTPAQLRREQVELETGCDT